MSKQLTPTEEQAIRTNLMALYRDLYTQFSSNKTTDIYGTFESPSRDTMFFYARAIAAIMDDHAYVGYPHAASNGNYVAQIITPVIAGNFRPVEEFKQALEQFDLQRLAGSEHFAAAREAISDPIKPPRVRTGTSASISP